jgi:tight adherence protein B
MLFLMIVALFFSVIFLTIAVTNILESGADEYKKKYVNDATADFESMFIFISPNQLFVLNIAITAGVMLLGLWLFDKWTYRIAISIFSFFVPGMLIKRMKKKRLALFNRQLVDSLVQMANAFKAGLSFPQALESIAVESIPPLSLEFNLAIKELKLGVSVDEALVNMSNRVGSDDLELVVVSTNIARKMGGNMAEMYDIISATIRERFRLEGKIAALVAQGKMQGWVVGLMPFVLFLVLGKMRPDLMEPMMDSWFGVIAVIIIMILETLGGLMIKKIVNIDV